MIDVTITSDLFRGNATWELTEIDLPPGKQGGMWFTVTTPQARSATSTVVALECRTEVIYEQVVRDFKRVVRRILQESRLRVRRCGRGRFSLIDFRLRADSYKPALQRC